MPSTTSSSVSRLLASSTVITPSLPTFCMASAIIVPISRSPFSEFVDRLLQGAGDDPADVELGVCGAGANVGNLDRVLDLRGPGLDVVGRRVQAVVDPALQGHRVHAGRHRLEARARGGLGEYSG